MIELLVAMGLSALLLIIAITVFRTTLRSISILDRMSRENALIRAGYTACTEDIDFWHSHANPAFPWLRSHNAEIPVSRDASMYGPRLFSPTTWPASLADPANPNWRQAHDPRAWYRGFLVPGELSGHWAMMSDFIGDPYPGLTYPNTRLRYMPEWTTTGSPNLSRMNGLTALGIKIPGIDRDQNKLMLYRAVDPFSSGKERREIPQGWQWWHLVGDYAALSNVDGWSDDLDDDGQYSASESCLDNFPGRHDHPQGMIDAFARLGIFGVLGYMPPGTFNLITASSVNLRDNRIGKPEGSYRRGELPWQFQAGGDLLSNGTSVAPGGFVATPRRNSSKLSIDAARFGRYAYYANMPSFCDMQRSNYKVGPSTSLGIDLDLLEDDYRFLSAYLYNRGGNGFFRSGDPFAETYGVGVSSPADRRMPFITMGVVYPTAPELSDFSARTYADDLFAYDSIRPLQILSSDYAASVTEIVLKGATAQPFVELSKETWQKVRERQTATTWHVPLAYSDQPDPDFATGQDRGLRMATSMFRTRFRRQDRAESRIVITDDKGGEVFEFRFTAMGATYRGARQHWGRITDPGATISGGPPIVTGAPVPVYPRDSRSASFTLGDRYAE